MRAGLICTAALFLAAAAPADTPQTSFAKCAARYSAIGLPELKSDGSDAGPVRLCRQGYALAYNPDTRTPDWVMERLPQSFLAGNAVRKNNFHTDDDANAVVPDSSSTNPDYVNTGFDKGHQAPAGDFKSSQPMTDQSFLMTNMAPQVGIGFNRNIWKQLETDVRAWILCGNRKELYVVTGPVFYDGGEKWIPNGRSKRVRVPDAFFKVIYDPKNARALGMMLPNKKLDTADLPKYTVAIGKIEAATGIRFFPALTTRQHTVLTRSKSPYWSAGNSCQSASGE